MRGKETRIRQFYDVLDEEVVLVRLIYERLLKKTVIVLLSLTSIVSSPASEMNINSSDTFPPISPLTAATGITSKPNSEKILK